MNSYYQKQYGHIPYPAPGYEDATLATAGCGPCAAAMAAEVLTGETHSPESVAKLARECGARVPGGTDLRRLGAALCARLGLKMETGSGQELLLDTLKKGGAAVCNVAGDREGYTGLFSDAGHYVTAIGLTEEGLVKVRDPGRYAGKYDKEGRRGRAALDGHDVVVTAKTLAQDCAGRSPAFYCFQRQAEPASPWAEEAWRKAVNRRLLDGTGPAQPLTREQLALVLLRLGLL